MSANPHIDQLAAKCRDRARAIPPETAERMARYVTTHLRTELSGSVPDEQIGAVLIAVSGAVFGMARELGLNPIGIGNALAIGGERLYTGARRSPFLKREDPS